jgi:hypothetical protein
MERWPYHPQKKSSDGVKSPFSQFDVSSTKETQTEKKEKPTKKISTQKNNTYKGEIKEEYYQEVSQIQTRKRKWVMGMEEIQKAGKKEKMDENILPSFEEFLYGVKRLENN